MGLFDGLRGQQSKALTAEEAMLLACMSMIAIDGDVDDDELAVLRRIHNFGGQAAWDNAFQAFRHATVGDCVSIAANAMNDAQRKFTMANLIDIAMADGFLAGDEKTLLERYFSAFELSELFVSSIIEAVSIKNDSSPFQ